MEQTRSKTAKEDQKRLKSYNDEKIAVPFRENLAPDVVQKLYSRKFVVYSQSEHGGD